MVIMAIWKKAIEVTQSSKQLPKRKTDRLQLYPHHSPSNFINLVYSRYESNPNRDRNCSPGNCKIRPGARVKYTMGLKAWVSCVKVTVLLVCDSLSTPSSLLSYRSASQPVLKQHAFSYVSTEMYAVYVHTHTHTHTHTAHTPEIQNSVSTNLHVGQKAQD